MLVNTGQGTSPSCLPSGKGVDRGRPGEFRQERHPGGEGLPSLEPSAKQSDGDASQMLRPVQWVRGQWEAGEGPRGEAGRGKAGRGWWAVGGW